VEEVLITAIACRSCENAPCVRACPKDALEQDENTGIIRVDPAKCDACAGVWRPVISVPFHESGDQTGGNV
jgi:Fe-S-cluster-containing dehydrogenase component